MRPTNTNSRGVARQLGTAVSLATALAAAGILTLPAAAHATPSGGWVQQPPRPGKMTEDQIRAPCAPGSAANT